MYAAAYLRRSSVSIDSPGDASRDAQLAAVRSLCGEDVTVYTDWGISGRKADRPDYQRLRADIAAGKVSSVCAYSLSRLGRSTIELLRFVELCQDHNVPIRTNVENIDTSSAMGRMLLTIMAAVAQLEAELAQERIGAALAAKRANGDELGQPHYGYRHVKRDGRVVEERDPAVDLEPIRQAYVEAGSVLGAVRLLRDRGVPSPRGRREWGTSALTRVVERNWPELLPQRNARGRRVPTSASVFAQLVACPFCGTTMTPNTHRGQLYCRFGARDRRTHPRYSVTEAALLPAAKAEAARFRLPTQVESAAADEAKVAALDGKRERVLDLYVSGLLDKADRNRRLAAIEYQRTALDAQKRVVAVPTAIDWESWPPEQINAVLRTFWSRVELRDDMTLARFVWRLPPEYVA
jgi:DNA invertase Pin-like site-specific DNA recombinase